MSTDHGHAHSAPSTFEHLRHLAAWIRRTPAPRWEGDPEDKAVFAGYLVASMVGWTAVGLAAAAGLGQALEVLASALG